MAEARSTLTTYCGRFADGEAVEVASEEPLAYAWRVTILEGGVATRRTGFSGVDELITEAVQRVLAPTALRSIVATEVVHAKMMEQQAGGTGTAG